MRVVFALFVKVFLHSGLILLACYEHAATLGGIYVTSPIRAKKSEGKPSRLYGTVADRAVPELVSCPSLLFKFAPMHVHAWPVSDSSAFPPLRKVPCALFLIY